MSRIIDKLKEISADGLLRRLVKNASYLLSGDFIASLLGLGSFALTTRALGVEKFGALVLVQVYVGVIDRLINFQSWQALIKYGASYVENDSEKSFKRLIKFGSCLDVGTAFLGTGVALVGISFAASWQDWSGETVQLAQVYSFLILLNLVGTPTAILRLFDKFKPFAIAKVSASALKLGAVTVAFFLEAGLWTYGIIWFLGEALSYVMLLFFGHRALYKRGIYRFWKVPLRSVLQENEDIWSYVWTTNFHGSVRMLTQRFDTFVVGGILGTASAGLYKVAKEVARILSRFSQPLYKAIYPELAKLWSEGQVSQFKRLIYRAMIIAGVASITFWAFTTLFGGTVIGLMAGQDYLAAKPVLVWYTLAICLGVTGFPLTPALLSMGYPKLAFYLNLASTLIYFVVLMPLTKSFGLSGVGISYLAYYIFWALGMFWMMYKGIGRRIKSEHIV